MSDHTPSSGTAHADPMSHVPPGSIWPLLVTIPLVAMPFGVLSLLGVLKGSPVGPLADPQVGLVLLMGGGVMFLYCLMGWCHQIIREKTIAHDVVQQQKDLQLFVLLFLCGEFAAFGAIFGFFFHRFAQDPSFGPVPGMHFGGPLVALATFLLLSSSVTGEFAHHLLQAGRIGLARIMFFITILLGAIFLGMTGHEWGELIQRGFTPGALAEGGPAAFAAAFYTGTGFHALHVATGLVLLFMVAMRLEAGAFRGKRHFAAVAATWYWHFVDVVWVALFITVYVVP
ncbi:MAG: heme-copper oxidase subunit III [Planctomycetes bacterium]|nr:heme-copper oxidase subunit III [Planctomycetota bacterium]